MIWVIWESDFCILKEHFNALTTKSSPAIIYSLYMYVYVCCAPLFILHVCICMCTFGSSARTISSLSPIKHPSRPIFSFIAGTHKFSGSSASWSRFWPMDPWSRSLHQLPKGGVISGVQQDNCGLRLEEHWIPNSLFQLVLPVGHTQHNSGRSGAQSSPRDNNACPSHGMLRTLDLCKDPLGIFVAGKLEALPTRCSTLQFPCCLGPGINWLPPSPGRWGSETHLHSALCLYL